MAVDAGVTLAVHSQPAIFAADADRLVQTLTNLISNAVKFSSPGSTVQIHSERRDGEILFAVADHGRGVPAAKLETIFERFEQVDASDSREQGRHRARIVDLPQHRRAAQRADLGAERSRRGLHVHVRRAGRCVRRRRAAGRWACPRRGRERRYVHGAGRRGRPGGRGRAERRARASRHREHRCEQWQRGVRTRSQTDSRPHRAARRPARRRGHRHRRVAAPPPAAERGADRRLRARRAHAGRAHPPNGRLRHEDPDEDRGLRRGVRVADARAAGPAAHPRGRPAEACT